MHITTIGDVVLDVIVELEDELRPDDDTRAHITLGVGGQAANTAAWAVALGASATVVGPRAPTAAASLLAERLNARGVAFAGVPVARDGTVVSLVGFGIRTMASDAGDDGWLATIDPELIAARSDWLHLSGYPLLRSTDPRVVLPLVQRARDAGARVSIDLSSTALIEDFGASRFGEVLDDVAPDVLFANASEWHAIRWSPGRTEVVIKHGAEGAEVRRGAVTTRHPSIAGPVVDTTGAGDALAAGYLCGGPALAMRTAAQCITIRGAQPTH